MASELRVNTIKGAVGINTITVDSALSLNRPFLEMNQTITENYTLSLSKNVLSVGPVTINDGITVTIPSGSNWVVI